MSEIQFRNCLSFMLSMYRYGRKSDHIVIRISKFSWFPHFKAMFELTDGTLVVYEYVPIKPIQGKWLPPIFFEGRTIRKVYKLVDSISLDNWVPQQTHIDWRNL